MTIRKVGGLLVLMFLPLVASLSVEAYDPDTHGEIAKRTAEPTVSSVDQVLRSELGLDPGVNETFLGRSVRALIRDGAVLEDDPSTRSWNHFHNPLIDPWQQAGLNASFLGLSGRGQSSALWQQNLDQETTIVNTPLARQAGGGNWSWQRARQEFLEALRGATPADRETRFANTFLALGHLTHLIQDASVPAHVRNDPHPLYEGYESWVGTYRQGGTDRRGRDRRSVFLSLLNQPSTSPTLSLNAPTGNMQAPVPVARLIDANVFGGLNVDALAGTGQGICIRE